MFGKSRSLDMYFLTLIIFQYFLKYAYSVQKFTNSGFGKTCGNGHYRLSISYGTLYTATDTRSLLECTAKCSKRTECLSFSFCHFMNGTTCEMYDRSLYSTGLQCQDLTSANDCTFLEKVSYLHFTNLAEVH